MAINFRDTDNRVRVRIDNEENDDLIIKEIIKLPTVIQLNQTLDTALKNDIILDASLCSIGEVIVTDYEEDDDGNLIPVYNKIDLETDVNINNPNYTPDINNINAQTVTTQYESYLENNYLNNFDSDGSVNVTILNKDEIYYQNTVRFTRGRIQDKIPNTLPIGEYVCIIEYQGNKFYEASTLTINFNINRRLAICAFDQYYIHGSPKENIRVSGTLKDAETKRPIENCEVNFDLDGQTYTTTSQNYGALVLNMIIPDTHFLHCPLFITEEKVAEIEPGDPYEEEYDKEYTDDDGNIHLASDIEYEAEDTTSDGKEDIEDSKDEHDNTSDFSDEYEEQFYQNASYVVNLHIDNDSYYLSNTSITIQVDKLTTNVNIDTGDYNEDTEEMNFNGYVIANVLGNNEAAHYGRVNIDFKDFNYSYNNIYLDENGRFSTDIKLTDIYASYNQNDNSDVDIYTAYGTSDTIIYIDTNTFYEDGQDSIKAGNPIIIETSVKGRNDSPVTDGMIIFYLEKDGKVVYKYATELDSVGMATFVFNTTYAADYKLSAKYCGIFEYSDSETDKKYDIKITA